ncbi:hypothetical protein EON65_27115 [archaeon]|nr:MAG: hypothetical protein EON65_27115 [archaeon]
MVNGYLADEEELSHRSGHDEAEELRHRLLGLSYACHGWYNLLIYSDATARGVITLLHQPYQQGLKINGPLDFPHGTEGRLARWF